MSVATPDEPPEVPAPQAGAGERPEANGAPPSPGRAVTRRAFLAGLSAGAGLVAVSVYAGVSLPRAGPAGIEKAAPSPSESVLPTPDGILPAVATAHPTVRVASLAGLEVGDVVDFQYPTERSAASLFRLGRTAAGGLGPDRDIVAFATDCTHMGCPLRGQYDASHAILGPCPCHFTTFALTHRGMVVIGQATESLPQIILDLDGDDILAVGTLGIMYGFRDNLADAPLVTGL